MFSPPRSLRLAAGIAAACTALAAVPALAKADNGSPACLNGYMWRGAYSGDRVCVTTPVYNETQADNAAAASRRDPNAGYGPMGCKSGYVWRVARPSDLVCVLPVTRGRAADDNRAGPYRRNYMGLGVGRSGGKYTVSVAGVNIGNVMIGLYRSRDGKPLKGWRPYASAWARPGGRVSGFRTTQPVCSGANNAYFRAKDPTSGLWLERVYVSGLCVIID